jgi:hypothetical protein
LGKDAPLGRAVQRSGAIVAIPILCGLPPLRPDMIFGKDKGQQVAVNGMRLLALGKKVSDTAYGMDGDPSAVLGKLLAKTMDIDFDGIRRDLAG